MVELELLKLHSPELFKGLRHCGLRIGTEVWPRLLHWTVISHW